MTTMYTPDHEWINIEDHEAATVGITLHAQDALGDVVFVDLPEVGRSFKKGEVAGVVESVKAAADIFMPVTGEVVEVNEALRADPSLANSDPLGNGWFVNVHVPDMSGVAQAMDLPAPLSEARALAELRGIAGKNKLLKSFIGQGYHGTYTPGVILRNILENPAWYTAYTPYQAEISQGRMEALVNFQTMVTDLTG